MKNTVVLAIGRWMPIHLGHKAFLTNLAREYHTLIVGIGSCYENGTPRNCIPAVEREKLLRRIFAQENITNYVIVHLPDRPSFEEWFSDVSVLCETYGVTHFCTGNKEDILDVMKKQNLQLHAEMINPEDTSDFPYHATDIRNAILNGNTRQLDHMIPAEIKEAVLSQVAKEIKLVSEGKGQEFVPGRQTVDLVFILRDKCSKKKYVLIGKREDGKIDFPGYYAIPGGGINDFESPSNAAIRCFAAETGIEISIDNNCTEPAQITIRNLNNIQSAMHFIGIYASHDERINGSLGGGSQCFAVIVEESPERISAILHSTHDMVELKLVSVDDICSIDFAYDQKRMVYHALTQLGIPYDLGELLERFDENGMPERKPTSRSSAHKEGIKHGASHTHIYKWENNALHFLLQKRSSNKDSFPGMLDVSSAGHVEYGCDFLQTALKELSEELGIRAQDSDLKELFTQNIYLKSLFHSEDFIDNEINKIYALEADIDPNALNLQREEVAEVLWMSAEDITSNLESKDSPLCMNKDEMLNVIDMIRQQHRSAEN